MCMLNQSKSKCQSPPIPCWPRSLRPVCCQVKSNKTPFPLGGDTFTIALQFTPISMSCFYISIFLYITLLCFQIFGLCIWAALTIASQFTPELPHIWMLILRYFSPEFKIWNCILELKPNKTPFPLGTIYTWTFLFPYMSILFYFVIFLLLNL